MLFKSLGMSYDEIKKAENLGLRYSKSEKRMLLENLPTNVDNCQLIKFENNIGSSLPESYKEFLRNHNGGIPEFNVLHLSSNIRVINCFFALAAPNNFRNSLLYYLENYRDRIPKNTLPIASSGSGDLLLISTSLNNFGMIYYWDHNYESDNDASDFFENIEIVSNSFSELLMNLKSASNE